MTCNHLEHFLNMYVYMHLKKEREREQTHYNTLTHICTYTYKRHYTHHIQTYTHTYQIQEPRLTGLTLVCRKFSKPQLQHEPVWALVSWEVWTASGLSYAGWSLMLTVWYQRPRGHGNQHFATNSTRAFARGLESKASTFNRTLFNWCGSTCASLRRRERTKVKTRERQKQISKDNRHHTLGVWQRMVS